MRLDLRPKGPITPFKIVSLRMLMIMGFISTVREHPSLGAVLWPRGLARSTLRRWPITV